MVSGHPEAPGDSYTQTGPHPAPCDCPFSRLPLGSLPGLDSTEQVWLPHPRVSDTCRSQGLEPSDPNSGPAHRKLGSWEVLATGLSSYP